MKTEEEHVHDAVVTALVNAFNARPAHHSEIVQIDYASEINDAAIVMVEGDRIQIVTDNSMYVITAKDGARWVEKYDRETRERKDIRSFQGFKPRTPGCGVVFRGGYTTTPVLRWRHLTS